MADADLHLAARWVVAWDGASHRLIEHGEVVVDGGVVRSLLAFDHGPGWRKGRVWSRTYLPEQCQRACGSSASTTARTGPLHILVRALGSIWLHGGAAPRPKLASDRPGRGAGRRTLSIKRRSQ